MRCQRPLHKSHRPITYLKRNVGGTPIAGTVAQDWMLFEMDRISRDGKVIGDDLINNITLRHQSKQHECSM